MGCLIKTIVAILAIFGLCVGLYIGRIPHKLVGLTISQVMKRKQNLDGQVGRVEFNKLGEMSLYDLRVKAADGKTDMIEIPRLDIGLSLANIRNGMAAADKIHIEGGTIMAGLVGKLFRQRRQNRGNGDGTDGESTGGGSGGGDGDGSGGGSGQGGTGNGGTGNGGTGNGGIKPTPNRGKRVITFKDLTLVGATRTMNLIITKRKITMKIKEIEGEMIAEGPKVTIKRLKWSLLGAVKPEVNDIELDMDEIRNGKAIQHLPREIKGLVLTIWILMGGKPDAALQA